MQKASHHNHVMPTELREHLLQVAHKTMKDMFYVMEKGKTAERARELTHFNYERTWRGFKETEPMHPMDADYKALEYPTGIKSGLLPLKLIDHSPSRVSVEIGNVTELMSLAVDTNDTEWFNALSERYDKLLHALLDARQPQKEPGFALSDALDSITSDDDDEDEE